MTRRIVYTDPAWAVTNGAVDPGAADIEYAIYGEDVDLRLGIGNEGRFVLDGPAFRDLVKGADALVIYRCTVTPSLLEAVGKQCKVVARQGVGFDNLNADLLRNAGIYGFHVPDYCGDEVGTHALSLALALERRLIVQDRAVRSGKWNIHVGGVPRRTSELVAGIVGFGRIGTAISRKLQVIYGSVQAHDPFVSSDLMASHGVRYCRTLAELFSSSDVVLLHAALTPGTDGMIDADLLRHAKPGLLLVNAARGRLVDPAAVLAALEDGPLGGFASDVFSPEDPNEDPHARGLLARDDVVVTAHRAFLSDEAERRLRTRVAEGVNHVLDSKTPPQIGRLA